MEDQALEAVRQSAHFLNGEFSYLQAFIALSYAVFYAFFRTYAFFGRHHYNGHSVCGKSFFLVYVTLCYGFVFLMNLVCVLPVCSAGVVNFIDIEQDPMLFIFGGFMMLGYGIGQMFSILRPDVPPKTAPE